MSTQKGATEKTGPRSAGVAALAEWKDERLRILSEAPIVLETPHSLLAGHTVTPRPILFVRNVQQLPEGRTLEPLQLADWNIVLAGLIREPVTIRGAELLEMEQVEHEMVLQCSGNGRSKFSEAYPVKGTAWEQGGVANVRFAGVPLSAVLKKHEVKIDRSAQFIAAEGKDLPQRLKRRTSSTVCRWLMRWRNPSSP